MSVTNLVKKKKDGAVQSKLSFWCPVVVIQFNQILDSSLNTEVLSTVMEKADICYIKWHLAFRHHFIIILPALK